MNGIISVSLVCCDSTPERRSRVAMATIDLAAFSKPGLVYLTEQQELPPDLARGMHLAVAPNELGEATFLQQIHEGEFYIYVGDPSCLQEHRFGPGSWVAFNDDEGSGHASKSGPDGCKRTMRILRGEFHRGHWPPTAE